METTTVEYHGPEAEVEVPTLGMLCKRGETIDVPADVAKNMLEQEANWRRPKAAKVTASKAAPKDGDDA